MFHDIRAPHETNSMLFVFARAPQFTSAPTAKKQRRIWGGVEAGAHIMRCLSVTEFGVSGRLDSGFPRKFRFFNAFSRLGCSRAFTTTSANLRPLPRMWKPSKITGANLRALPHFRANPRELPRMWKPSKTPGANLRALPNFRANSRALPRMWKPSKTPGAILRALPDFCADSRALPRTWKPSKTPGAILRGLPHFRANLRPLPRMWKPSRTTGANLRALPDFRADSRGLKRMWKPSKTTGANLRALPRKLTSTSANVEAAKRSVKSEDDDPQSKILKTHRFVHLSEQIPFQYSGVFIVRGIGPSQHCRAPGAGRAIATRYSCYSGPLGGHFAGNPAPYLSEFPFFEGEK